MDLDLSGRTTLVTGSTSDIRYAVLRGLADLRARVVLHGRTAGTVERALEKFRSERPDASNDVCAGGLASAADCETLVNAIPEVGSLVNQTDIYHILPFTELDDSEWQQYFDVNVMSSVRLSRHDLPGMQKRDWGRTVFISSESGVHIPPDMIPYGFSKAARLTIGRGLAETMGAQA